MELDSVQNRISARKKVHLVAFAKLCRLGLSSGEKKEVFAQGLERHYSTLCAFDSILGANFLAALDKLETGDPLPDAQVWLPSATAPPPLPPPQHIRKAATHTAPRNTPYSRPTGTGYAAPLPTTSSAAFLLPAAPFMGSTLSPSSDHLPDLFFHPGFAPLTAFTPIRGGSGASIPLHFRNPFLPSKRERIILRCLILPPGTKQWVDRYPKKWTYKMDSTTVTNYPHFPVHLSPLKVGCPPMDITANVNGYQQGGLVALSIILHENIDKFSPNFVVGTTRLDEPLDLLPRLTTLSMDESRAKALLLIGGDTTDSDAVSVIESNLPLLCPSTLSRIETPARGQYCSHLQCFDALSYLQANWRVPSWRCTVCNQPLPLSQLIVDTYVKSILNSPLTSNQDEVIINPNLTWAIRDEEPALSTPAAAPAPAAAATTTTTAAAAAAATTTTTTATAAPLPNHTLSLPTTTLSPSLSPSTSSSVSTLHRSIAQHHTPRQSVCEVVDLTLDD